MPPNKTTNQQTTKMTTTTTTKTKQPVRIKVDFGYYPDTYCAPQNGYLRCASPEYDRQTGKWFCRILDFNSVADAIDHLTHPLSDSCYQGALECDYDGDGEFVFGGPFQMAYGQHSRPVYTIVSRTSGRCNKSILSEIERIEGINN